MVYCTECGTKNEDDYNVCVKCGKPLKLFHPEKKTHPKDECFGSRKTEEHEECFGLPYGRAIAGIIFGIVIIIVGISLFLGQDVWRWLWAAIIIVVGILIISGVLYSRKKLRR